MRSAIHLLAPLLALILGACDDQAPAPSKSGRRAPSAWKLPNKSRAEQPDHIEVAHILIGVRSPSFKQGLRSKAAAEAFAKDLFKKLQAGGNWPEACRQHTEDKQRNVPGGPYAMANSGVRPAGPKEFPRSGMVPAFGDVGFQLEVGEIGLAEYDPVKSPFGYHIIKRTQ